MQDLMPIDKNDAEAVEGFFQEIKGETDVGISQKWRIGWWQTS